MQFSGGCGFKGHAWNTADHGKIGDEREAGSGPLSLRHAGSLVICTLLSEREEVMDRDRELDRTDPCACDV